MRQRDFDVFVGCLFRYFQLLGRQIASTVEIDRQTIEKAPWATSLLSSVILYATKRGKSFVFTPGNTNDRSEMAFDILKKKLFGSVYDDKGYISAPLFKFPWNEGIHIVTGLRSNMKRA